MKAYTIHTLALLFFIFLSPGISAQEEVYILDSAPVIDGFFDKSLPPAGLKNFKDIQKTNSSLPDTKASYFLGYTSKYFYIYIEAESDSMVIRDRAHQNGDGFHLVLGKGSNETKIDEFYVLGFSAAKNWMGKMQWYYNVDLKVKRLGDDLKFKSSSSMGKIRFELLIPWSTVKPYHPWISESIAFNLCFVKALNSSDKSYHFIKVDERMQSEQSRRKYVRLTFDEAGKHDGFYSLPSRHNYLIGNKAIINLAGSSGREIQKNFTVKLLSPEEEEIYSEDFCIKTNPGLSEYTLKPDHGFSSSGNYVIRVFEEGDLLNENTITVFDSINIPALRDDLGKHKDNISEGSYNTISFYINDLENEIKNLKSYESSATINNEITRIKAYLEIINNGKDPLACEPGARRRAFLSKLDSTLRPYSVYVPEEYSHAEKYPLLVYLHGSGQDDRALFNSDYIKQGFIVLAPNGRGTSNCYATTESQTDIREAVEDVFKNFNIDREKVILSGFSMGGYGVYMTHYENPQTYSALAIISGHPYLAKKWGYGERLNFLDENLAASFSDIPVFVYHALNDMNCTWDITSEMINKLKKHNDRIIFKSDKNSGHGSMNDDIKKEYHDWLIRNVRSGLRNE